MSSSRTGKRDYHDILTTQGINKELWKWLRAHAALQRKSVGEIVNEMVGGYREEVRRLGRTLDLSSPYKLQPEHQHSIRGVDRTLWQWLKAQSILDERFLGEILNGLIYRYMNHIKDNTGSGTGLLEPDLPAALSMIPDRHQTDTAT
jgi:hypothetical protein